jgi:tetratricopeptide (TPR) repeat protein
VFRFPAFRLLLPLLLAAAMTTSTAAKPATTASTPAAASSSVATSAPTSTTTTAAAASPAPASTPAPAPSRLREEADAHALAAILADQGKLLNALENDPATQRLPFNERERRVLDLCRRYEALSSRRPEDAVVMVLYGKFLRLVSNRDLALQWFEKAARLMPDSAIIKHQRGLHAAEDGDYKAALPLLEAAAAREPRIAGYHFHLGEFLTVWRDHLVKDGLLTRAACDAKMLSAFRAAAVLKPGETAYPWRFAMSFFDCEKPDWAAALAAWDVLIPAAKEPLEREALALYRARVLAGLGRYDEAAGLLALSKTPRFETSRAKVREVLAAAARAPKPAPQGR